MRFVERENAELNLDLNYYACSILSDALSGARDSILSVYANMLRPMIS